MSAAHEVVGFLQRTPIAKRVVVLTGAGISVASGLRPYRGPGGLWTANPELANELVAGMSPEKLWSVARHWEAEVTGAEPNAAHVALATFERAIVALGGSFTLITQNVDSLHVRAGSRNVIEFHGALRRSRCSMRTCGAQPFDDVPRAERPSACTTCGAPVRPDLVLFNEEICAAEERAAKIALRDVELFVAIGTSGTVSPASNFVRAADYEGARTVFVNLEISAEARSLYDEVHAGDSLNLVPRLFLS